MSKYIQFIPDELIRDICEEECLPVIGAGFSRNATLPSGCRMPLWNDLGAEAAKKMGTISTGNAVKDLSAFCDSRGRFALVRFLMECLHLGSAMPGAVHKEFARLPFRQVITTNFDFLLEQSYAAACKHCLPIVDEELLQFSPPDGGMKLLKMHGDFHHPSLLVVTEGDYDGFRDDHYHMFHEVTNLLVHNTLLFIGYSIDDPDFRQIRHLAKKYTKELDRPAFAVLVGATTAQTNEYQRRGVRTISLPGNDTDYSTVLTAAFREINHAVNHPARKKHP